MRIVQARLDKDRQYILCGAPSCGHRLARLDWAIPGDGPEETIEGKHWLSSLRTADEEGYVSFGPGWRRDEATGRWGLSKYAQRVLRKGKPPRNRRPLAPVRPGDKALHGRHAARPPLEVVCPRCAFPTVNLVTDEGLGIAAEARAWEAGRNPPWRDLASRGPEGISPDDIRNAAEWLRRQERAFYNESVDE